ncbi:MAG TPA: preprotein translocase subunit SecG [Hansschlegelia sp.]
MQTVLIVIHLMIVLALVVVVLLQRSEGGALGIGGGNGFMAGRGQGNPLTRLTAYLAGGFFVTSMALTIVAGYGGGSVFDRLQPTTTTPQPAPGGPSAPLGNGKGGILPMLQQQSGQAGAGAGGAPQPAGAPPQPEEAQQPAFSAPSAGQQPEPAGKAPEPTAPTAPEPAKPQQP